MPDNSSPPPPAVSADLFARTASLRISTAEIGRDKATVRPGASRRPPRCLIGLFCLLATAVGSPAARAQDEEPTRLTLIADDDGRAPYYGSVLEDNDVLVVTGRLDRPAPVGGVTVTLGGSPGGDASQCPSTLTDAQCLDDGYDYRMSSAAVFTIPAGETVSEDDGAIVTIALMDDTLDEGSETIVFDATTSPALTVAPVTATIIDNDGAVTGIVLKTEVTEISEEGGNQQLVRVIAELVGGVRTQATDVTATFSPGAGLTAADFTADPFTITIPANAGSAYNGQNVVPVDDDVADEGVILIEGTTTVGIPVTGTSIALVDSDATGFAVTLPQGATRLTTTEAGGTATFSVALASQPTANVVIGVSSDDTGEGTVAPSSLTFTPQNWNAAQTVTATGVNDDVDDGDQTWTVVLAAAQSTDTDYSGLDPDDVAVSNADDDTAGITVTLPQGATSLTTTEDGETDTFDVVLDSEPTANVVIGVSSDDTDEGTVAPPSLTFTPQNWNAAQTVTVTGVRDQENDGDQTYTVVLAAAQSTDTDYSGLDPDDVSVTNEETNAAPTGAVTIDGTATQRETLTAVTDTIADPDGPETLIFSYQWHRDGADIPKATEASYRLVQADVGKAITVTASWTDDGGKEESLTSEATDAVENVNNNPNGQVTISGAVTEGETLTAVTNTISDPDGPATLTFSYQWKRDGTDITSATEETYDLVQADVGAAITVTVSWTDAFNTEESLTSDATAAVANVNDEPTGAVTISGTATQGETLTAVTSTIADPDGPETLTFSYQWHRDGTDIPGATGATYVPAQADVGAAITVTVSWTDDGNTAESLTSTPTAAVTDVNDAPTGAVTITGTATQGETLTADTSGIADADGLGAFT